MKLIDPMDFSNDPLLSNIQGNILKGHGRDYTTHIFLQFQKGKEKTASAWIGIYLAEKVTSFKKQLWERERFKRNRVPGGIFTGLFLTAAGYAYLGMPEVDTKLDDKAFLDGMKKRLPITCDPDPKDWEQGFRKEAHAMILLADDNVARMELAAREIVELSEGFATVVAVEYGNVIRNENGDGIEHFGYVDGISQPLFLKDEVDEWMKFHNADPKAPKDHPSSPKFDPTADTDLVLVKDPYTDEPDSFGSYFVFRKLEQNVKGFKEAEEDLELGELGGAYLVGRFEDGSPVVLTDDEGLIGAGNYNNFNYGNTPQAVVASASRCPYFAHIRKTNPRDNKIPDGKRVLPVMARRGIPFGQRDKKTAIAPCKEEFPEKGVGLLFMSYQRSIEDQFEVIQHNMANNPDFPNPIPGAPGTGVDAIIGQLKDQHPAKHEYQFPAHYGKPALTARLPFTQFVTMKGGEYFFTPSIPFLRSLKPSSANH
ncbi:peroxidase [Paraflavitalea soli]|uniref:Peroxidase n=1 Tax=Paraflavitalea soli TaxID=2315862 RepID=A0A3B7MN51_9BACT|nr:peroxidase [Paraflavitalea soli]AXY75892.1 peroxidase [Paraflavitalea soli]